MKRETGTMRSLMGVSGNAFGAGCCLTGLATLLATQAAMAGERGPIGEIVVRGERPRVVEAVGTLDEIHSGSIEASGARSLSEAIDLTPGVNIRTGGDGLPRIDMRGLRTRNVQLLLDGVPLNSSYDGQFDPNLIPVETVEKIKLTRGVASLLYGPGGNAGVINIVTASGRGTHASARAEKGFQDNGYVSGSAGVGDEKVGALFAISSFEQDHWDLPDGFAPTALEDGGSRLNSDQRRLNMLGRVGMQLTPRVGVAAVASYREAEYGKPPSTESSGASPYATRARFERVDTDGYSLQLAAEVRVTDSLALNPAVFFNRTEESTMGYDDPTFSTQARAGAFEEEAQTTVYGGRFAVSHDDGGALLSSIALSYRHEGWQAAGFTLVAASGGGGGGGGGGGSRPPVRTAIDADRAVKLYSASIEEEWRATERLSLVAGLGFSGQSRPGADESGLSYLAGASYDLSGTTALHLSHARAVRYPSLRDLYETGYGNPALERERTDHFETGVDHRLNDLALDLGAVLFWTDADGFIERGLSGVAENVETLRLRGMELSAAFGPVSGLTARLTYTFLDADNLSTGAETQTLQNRPRHQASFEATYRAASGWEAHGEYRLGAGSYALSRQSPVTRLRLDSSHVVDLRVAKSILNGRAKIYARADNAFDAENTDSFGFPQPGRTFFLGLSANLSGE